MYFFTDRFLKFSSTRRAAWGFHPGGWGKPPLDDFGRPLYGDIYGVTQKFAEGEVSNVCARRFLGVVS